MAPLRFTAGLAPGDAGFPRGPLLRAVDAASGAVSWTQEFGALMMQSGGALGGGHVLLRTGGVPAGSYAFSVTG